MTSARVPRPLSVLLVALTAAAALAACGPAAATDPAAGDASPTASAGAVADARFVATGHARTARAALDSLHWSSFDPAAAYLRGPHFALRLAGVATVPELSPELLDACGITAVQLPDGTKLPAGQGLRAAPGAEFLLTRAVNAGFSHFSDNTPAGFAVVVDGASRPLAATSLGADQIVLASVPIGSKVQLAVADAQRTQTIDLRTGTAGGRVPLEYPERGAGVSSLGDLFLPEVSAAQADQAMAGYTLDVTVTLLPWTPEKGWAPAGHGWLEVAVSSVLTVRGEVKLDLGRSLTLRTTGGHTVPLTGTLDIKTAGEMIKEGPSLTEAVDVPADTTGLTVTLFTHGAVLTTGGKPGDYRRYANKHSTATLTLAPVQQQG